MEETLFRGKPVNKADYTLYEELYKPDVFNEGFVYGSLIVKGKKHYICIGVAGVMLNCLINNATVSLVEVVPETVGRYTGLTDKNGKKIFEGDIVAYEDAEADYEGYHDNVFMNRGEVVLSAQNGIGFTNRQTVEMDDLFIDEIMIDCKVIGNIHDNPELLEVL